MKKKWVKLGAKSFKGSYKSYVTEKYRLPNGHVADFDVSLGPDFVVVFALTNDGRVVCVQQYRPGPEQVMTEMVMGLIDKGESPEHAAGRELLEETGYKAVSLIQLTDRVPISPYDRAFYYGFLALDCQSTGQQDLEITESIEPKLMSVEAFKTELLEKGLPFRSSVAWLALQKLESFNR